MPDLRVLISKRMAIRGTVLKFELDTGEVATCVVQADRPTEMRFDVGIPSAAIRLSTWLSTRASTCWRSNACQVHSWTFQSRGHLCRSSWAVSAHLANSMTYVVEFGGASDRQGWRKCQELSGTILADRQGWRKCQELSGTILADRQGWRKCPRIAGAIPAMHRAQGLTYSDLP